MNPALPSPASAAPAANGSSPLSPSMIHDLPMVTNYEEHAQASILATHGASVLAGEGERATHNSRKRRRTKPRTGDSREDLVFQQGDRLIDRYEVLRKIGQGGMSLVYEAYDEIRNEPVALKVLLPHLAAKPKLQERFLQEGRLSSNFSHPNIARVYDLHQTESWIMLSMELLHGSTLRHDMERRKNQRQTYQPAEVLATMQQIGRALTTIHQADVIHRDLKPENLWLGLDETVKVMDFGIARDSLKTAYTTGPRGSGTPYYIAPEQLSASPSLDHRADQYSLAVIAYEMLTGEIPQGVVRPPHAVRSGIPRRLSKAIYRAMQSDPDKRFKDIDSFCQAALFRTHTSPWLRAGMMAAIMATVAMAIVGFQRYILPMLESKPSPVWAMVDPQRIAENEEISFGVRHPEATLAKEDLTFKLLSDAPIGASINPTTGVFTWRPDEAQGPKDYAFKVMAIVKQNGGAPVVEEQLFQITVDEVYHAPKMDSPQSMVAKEHLPWEYRLEATDINQPPVGLRYELIDGPAGMEIDARQGVLKWTPQESDGGSVAIASIRISLDDEDHADASITRKVNLRVEESIDPPKFTSGTRLQAKVGEAVQFRLTARDPNLPEINRFFRLRNGDRLGMTVDPQTGEVFWSPSEDQAGKEMELIAEIGWDGAGKSQILAEQTIKVSVAEIEVPPAPVEPEPEASKPDNPPAPAPINPPSGTGTPGTGSTCPNPAPGQGGGNPGSTCPTQPGNGNNQGSGGNGGGNGQCSGNGNNQGVPALPTLPDLAGRLGIPIIPVQPGRTPGNPVPNPAPKTVPIPIPTRNGTIVLPLPVQSFPRPNINPPQNRGQGQGSNNGNASQSNGQNGRSNFENAVKKSLQNEIKNLEQRFRFPGQR